MTAGRRRLLSWIAFVSLTTWFSGLREISGGTGRVVSLGPADNLQEIVSGIKLGAEVISNALVFQNTVEQ